MAVEGHQPQHPRSFRVVRLVFDTAALREDDFVNGLGDERNGAQKCFTVGEFKSNVSAKLSSKNRCGDGNMEGKLKTIEEFRVHERDTGSADVQIALLTQRINHLTDHLQKNRKDHGSRRGLLMMVGQRRRLLDYLHSTDVGRYQSVTKKLKISK